MKSKKYTILLLAIAIMFLSACSTKKAFVLKSNLKNAITELALRYDEF